MLEATSHKHLKDFLQTEEIPWSHNLTLSRLVARSLRRKDRTLISLDTTSNNFWWVGLLIPLCLQNQSGVLILSPKERSYLLTFVLPKLRSKGFELSIWEGDIPPPSDNQLWLLDYYEFISSYRKGLLKYRQLIFPQADCLSEHLREVMQLRIEPSDWDKLQMSCPCVSKKIIKIHDRLSSKLFSQASRIDANVRMDFSAVNAVKSLIKDLKPLPFPWEKVINTNFQDWASWSVLDHQTLKWTWFLKPLDPLSILVDLSKDNPFLLVTTSGQNSLLSFELKSFPIKLDLQVDLGFPNYQQPISLFAPCRQPLPNTPIYAEHLLVQSRRLILCTLGLTIILLDDDQLRKRLTSELAAEFGLRVVHEEITTIPNGVICCRCSWWLNNQGYFPIPDQLIFALLPFPSLESPFIAARVDALKHQRRDWFRDLLLPEVLSVLPRLVVPLRTGNSRIAILDGRLRARSWGRDIFRALEPWNPLHRLLPN